MSESFRPSCRRSLQLEETGTIKAGGTGSTKDLVGPWKLGAKAQSQERSLRKVGEE